MGDDAHGRRRQEVQQIDRGGLLLRNTQNERHNQQQQGPAAHAPGGQDAGAEPRSHWYQPTFHRIYLTPPYSRKAANSPRSHVTLTRWNSRPPTSPPASPPMRYGSAAAQSKACRSRYTAALTALRGSMAATQVAKACLPSRPHQPFSSGTSTMPPPPPNSPFTSPAAVPDRAYFVFACIVPPPLCMRPSGRGVYWHFW